MMWNECGNCLSSVFKIVENLQYSTNVELDTKPNFDHIQVLFNSTKLHSILFITGCHLSAKGVEHNDE